MSAPGHLIGALSTAVARGAASPLSEEAANEGLRALMDLIRQLGQRSDRTRQEPLLVILDSAERLPNTPLLREFSAVAHRESGHPQSILLGTRSQDRERLIAQVPAVGGDASKHLTLKPPAAAALADWIDMRMATGGVNTNDVGKACVEHAAGSPAKAVQLARKTFDLSITARYAHKGTVEAAFRLNAGLGRDGNPGASIPTLKFDFSFTAGRANPAIKV